MEKKLKVAVLDYVTGIVHIFEEECEEELVEEMLEEKGFDMYNIEWMLFKKLSIEL
jgi:hypothetical protein